MKRRKFIAATTSATTALFLTSLDTFATPQTVEKMDTNFQLKILATNWGFPGTLDQYCAKVKQEGYDGIEVWWPSEKKDHDELFTTLKKYSLEVGFLTAGHESSFKENFDSFKKMTEAAVNNKVQQPLYINCHSGKDYFSYEDNKKIIDYTVALSKSSGIKICHETHRSRILFAAPVAKNFMETIPDLRITLDRLCKN